MNEKSNPYATALWLIAGLAFAVLVILTIATLSEMSKGYADPTALATIGTWSNVAAAVAFGSTVGALVLGGVRWLLQPHEPKAELEEAGAVTSDLDN